MYIYIYIYVVTPPGPIRALGAGVIILDNYISSMITCSKTLHIKVKNTFSMHMTLNILIIQQAKTSFLKPESGSEKDQNYLQIVSPLHEKWTWPFKKLHGKQKMPYASRISANNRNNIKKYKWTHALGFELQSAPHLHRDKQNKQTKTLEMVAPSHVDCEVFFCPCAGFVHFKA